MTFEQARFLWNEGQRGQSRVDLEEGRLLWNVAATLPQGSVIVEVGRMHGGTTLLLAMAAPLCHVVSIDCAPTDDQKLRNQMAELGISNIELIVGDSRTHRFDRPISMLFIDGDHSKEGCLADYSNWSKYLAPSAHVVFHDSSGHNSDIGCVEATNELVAKGILKNERPNVISIRHFVT